jgi:signal peptidase I
MNILLWGIFYLVTAIFLAYFFFKEKEVIDFIKVKEDLLLNKISLEENEKNLKTGNIITVAGLIVTVIFFFISDRTPDPNVGIKIIGIYGMFILNVVFLVLRAQHEWIFMGNIVMLILGRLMFNIMDVKFYIFLVINAILAVILIFLFRRPSKEEITERTLLEEMKEDKNKSDEKVTIENLEEKIEIEKKRRSSFGKALHRVDMSVMAVVLVLLIQTFYIGNYVIPTGSMEETIKIKDRVFANMVKYKFTSPKVNDIVAFKEPMTNKLMFTKRLVGVAGQTLQIKDIQEMNLTDPSMIDEDTGNVTVSTVDAGNIYLDDKKAEKLNRPYSKDGFLLDSKIYIPKKGDKVKIDKIVIIPKGKARVKKTDNFVTGTYWAGYRDGSYKFLTPEEFLARIGTDKGFKDIVGNEDRYEEGNPKYDVYYTFFLKVEGRDELVLPIMDFKYDDALFLKLLKGETLTLNKNYYMAMGDNTTNSLDSRFFGYVSEDRIKGKLLLRWWPLNRLGLI